jgi:phage shock protein PspC (stress-responsive transcriptional regulator)
MTHEMPGPAAGDGETRTEGAADAPPAAGAPSAGHAPPTADAADGPPARKLLTRSPRSKILGGVCGGLGRHLGIDPVVFRVVLVVLALTGGVGLITYGIGWLLIPMEGEEETEVRRLLSGRIEGTAMTAVLGTLVGSGLFLSTMDNGNMQAFALCLIGAVVAAVYWSQRRQAWLAALRADFNRAAGGATASGAGTVREAPPAAQPPPAGGPSWWRGPASVTVAGRNGPVSFVKTAPGVYTTARPGGGYLWGPEDGEERPAEEPGTPGPPGGRPDERQREDHGNGLYGALVFLVALLVGAATMTALWHRQPLGTTLEAGFAGMLVVLGGGMVVGAFLGRRGSGLIGWAIAASFLAAVSATMPKSVGTDWGSATWRPASTAAVRPTYDLGSGEGILDLTAAEPRHGSTVTTAVNMGAGRIEVRVPQDVTVKLVAKVGMGDIRTPNETHHDVNVSANRSRTGTYAPPAGVKPAGTVVLTLKLGVGQVGVLRVPTS